MSDASPARAVVSDDGVAIALQAWDGAGGPPTIVRLSLLGAAVLVADLAAALRRHLAAERNHVAQARRGPGQ